MLACTPTSARASRHPFVRTKHPGMDVVIVRENEEDLYAGIEYQATPDEIIALSYLPARQRKDRALRVRIRHAVQAQEGHLLHQGQHPQDDRRELP